MSEPTMKVVKNNFDTTYERAEALANEIREKTINQPFTISGIMAIMGWTEDEADMKISMVSNYYFLITSKESTLNYKLNEYKILMDNEQRLSLLQNDIGIQSMGFADRMFFIRQCILKIAPQQ